MIYLKAILAGIILGTTFGLLNLPIPAPKTLAGVVGVLGVFLGYLIINKIK